MTAAKHSSGPWRLIGKAYHSGITGEMEFCYQLKAANGRDICAIWGDDAEADFNAQLAASAPELLDALIKAAVMLHPDMDEYKSAWAAITRATGGLHV